MRVYLGIEDLLDIVYKALRLIFIGIQLLNGRLLVINYERQGVRIVYQCNRQHAHGALGNCVLVKLATLFYTLYLVSVL